MKNRTFVTRIIFFSILLILAVVGELIVSFQVNKLKSNYPRLKINEELSGNINSIYRPNIIRKSSGTVYVIIGNKNMRINTYIDSVPHGHELDNLLQIGDSIVKRMGSDSVFLYDYNSKELEYVYKLMRPE